MAAIPLTGDYEPGTSGWTRHQVERYEATGGVRCGDLRGRQVQLDGHRLSPGEIVDFLRSLPTLWADFGDCGRR